MLASAYSLYVFEYLSHYYYNFDISLDLFLLYSLHYPPFNWIFSVIPTKNYTPCIIIYH